MRKVQRPISDIITELIAWYKHSGLSQAELSRFAGVNQATVSRLLSSKSTRGRLSGALSRLCIYANISTHIEKPVDPTSSKPLMDALASTWDGTPLHAKRIANVIRQLSRL